MHVFQEQLVTGSRSASYDLKGQSNLEAIVNLQHIAVFEENFYLVVIEKSSVNGSSIFHMWRIVIASAQGLHNFI